MLDECKGERLEEVLAVFSSAVLKKLVAEQQLNQPEFPAIAQSWALENRGYSGERTELNVLVLAHRASLSRHLRDKNAARAQFHDFSELLDLKERSLARRRELAKALEAQERENGVIDEVTDDIKLDVWRIVRNNWSGNERWMETLLYGDEHARKDGLLSASFDRVWRRVQSGRLGELEDQAGGLLQQLDQRVTAQNERLAKWQSFRVKILGEAYSDPVEGEVQPSSQQKGVNLGFGAHENLHLGRMSPKKLPRGRPGQLTAEYADIITGLQDELEQVNKGSTVPRFLMAPRHPPVDEHNDSATEEVVSEISELEEEPHTSSHEDLGLPELSTSFGSKAESSKRSFAGRLASPTEVDSAFEPKVQSSKSSFAARFAPSPEVDMALDPKSQSPRRHDTTQFSPPEEEQMFTPRQRISTMQMDPELDWEECPPSATPTRAPRRPDTPGSGSPTRRTAFPIRTSPPKPAQASPERQVFPVRQVSPEREVSPTQELADQILASMNAASPSPVKKTRHTLSLAERTRLSMARRVSKAPALDDDEADLDSLPLSPIRRVPTVTVSDDSGYTSHQMDTTLITLTTPTEEPDEHGYEDLVARTRRSMAGFEAARKKAQLERRRSQRQSKQLPGHRRDGSSYFPSVDEEDNTTLLLAEELMSNEVDDPEAIFKSRPKIKTSPVGTPTRVWGD